MAEAKPKLSRKRPSSNSNGGRFTLSVTLTTGIGLLLVVSVLTVLGIGLWSARKNTLTLLSAQARLAIASSISQIDQHLKPAVDQTDTMAELIVGGEIDPRDLNRFGGLLIGALASAPQIKGLVFIDVSHQLFGARRGAAGELRTYRADYSDDLPVRNAIAAARERQDANWGPPIWRKAYRTTLLNLRKPVHRDGEFLGLLVAVISIGELSRHTVGLSDAFGNNAFILHDGTDVLAHPLMSDGFPGLSEAKPLPALEDFSDPILAAMARTPEPPPLTIELPEDTIGFTIDAFGERYVFISREVTGYGAKPWQVGAYYRAADLSEYGDRMLWSGVAGLVALAIAFVCALALSRGIARPVRRLAAAANLIERLEFDTVSELPGSRIRELDDQSKAFNAMLGGLRWFEVYVPKSLVRRLVSRGEEPVSEKRELTVMFTDIAGFTGVAEGVSAEALADFLNAHFALIAAAVEDTGGTLDKFIGDAVMAFWGAPEIQPDHAERACRAASDIAGRIAADNIHRRAQGLAPVRIRVGIHSGPAVVGNIGAPGRMNYTIVGDTVNVAQRLEQLGKRVYHGDPEVATLISDDTAARLASRDALESAGSFEIPGRREPVEVFKLV